MWPHANHAVIFLFLHVNECVYFHVSCPKSHPQREAVTQKADLWLEGDATFKDFLKREVRAGVGLCDHGHLPQHVTPPHPFMHCITWIGDYGRQLEAQGKQFRLLLRNYDEFASAFVTHGL